MPWESHPVYGWEEVKSGGLPQESYVNPWVLVTIKHADIQDIEGQLIEATVNEIAQKAAAHIGALD